MQQISVTLPDSVQAFHAVKIDPDLPWTVSATYLTSNGDSVVKRVEHPSLAEAIKGLEAELT